MCYKCFYVCTGEAEGKKLESLDVNVVNISVFHDSSQMTLPCLSDELYSYFLLDLCDYICLMIHILPHTQL